MKIKVSHILVDYEYEIEDIVKKINEGASFESLASIFSKCPSGQQGGFLGEFGRGKMVDEFEEAAFALDIGAISTPVKTQFGYHLIKREG